MGSKLAVIIPWFGPWPAWINFFVESCRWNRTIRWFLLSDQAPPENRAPNITHERIAFEDYRDLLSEALEIQLGALEPYKLCDLRPALPLVHSAMLRGFDFVATGDLDVIYGSIRSFYDERLLGSYDLLSSHRDRVSGHLCVMRNDERMLNAFRRIEGWQDAFSRPDYVNFDERALFNLLTKRRRRLLRKEAEPEIRCYLHEAYSTPAATDRMRWYWKDGRLTNEFYPHHPFMYLHFMSWHSDRWLAEQPGAAPGARAPWRCLPEIVQMDWRDAGRDGFMISPRGITRIEWPSYGAAEQGSGW
jgi:hypothetical protein